MLEQCQWLHGALRCPGEHGFVSSIFDHAVLVLQGLMQAIQRQLHNHDTPAFDVCHLQHSFIPFHQISRPERCQDHSED